MARRRGRGRPVHGILLLDKPTGMTSNKALQIARRLYGAAKAGHTGSLDPSASGMLPVCFGEATKVSGYMLNADKEYEVVASIGQRTDTADADGEVIETAELTAVTEEQLSAALEQLTGPIMQVPPMYSALKKDGRRLYELARKGEQVDRPPRPVTVHELNIVAFDPGTPTLSVRCSKGTYVRTLVEDVAARMGTLAHVAALRRTAVEPFGAAPMVTLDELEALEGDNQALDRLLLPVDAALQEFPVIRLNETQALCIRNGNEVVCDAEAAEGTVRLCAGDNTLLGMGECKDGLVAPKRLFPGLWKPPGGSGDSDPG